MTVPVMGRLREALDDVRRAATAEAERVLAALIVVAIRRLSGIDPVVVQAQIEALFEPTAEDR